MPARVQRALYTPRMRARAPRPRLHSLLLSLSLAPAAHRRLRLIHAALA